MTYQPIKWRERHFLGWEFALAVGAAGLFILWCELFDGLQTVQEWTSGNRTVIYATVASVGGVMLGFTITAVSVLIGYSEGARFTLLRRAGQLDTLWTIFFQAIWAFGASTLLALVGLVVNPSGLPDRIIMYVNILAFAVAVVRGYREVRTLQLSVRAVTND